MITNICEMLAKQSGKACYNNCDRKYLMSLTDDYRLSGDFTAYDDFKSIAVIREIYSGLKKNGEYAQMKAEYVRLKQKLKQTTEPELIRALRAEVKTAEAARAQKKKELWQRAAQQAGYDYAALCFLEYKKTLAVNSFDNICHFLPGLDKIDIPWIRTTPLFTKNIGGLAGVGQIAIEGGPCTFGADEVSVIVTMADGRIEEHDYNSLESGWQKDSKIADLDFVCHKRAISSQEREYFECLFAFAHCLKAPLVISIPDMSYFKYFKNIMGFLPGGDYEKAEARFKKAVYQIVDMYLEFIQKFSQRYKPPRLEVLHHRNTALLELFYEKRARFINGVRNITADSCKEDSVRDYVTMPAMPFYLWGICDIIEINSTDEADAIRKCIKLHREQARFYPVMIPEKVSRDRKTTVFYAKRELKDYTYIGELFREDTV